MTTARDVPPLDILGEDNALALPLKPAIFLFVGKPASGKSTAIRSIMYQYAKAGYFKSGICFCPSLNEDYDFLEEKRIIRDYSNEKLEAYIKALHKKRVEKKGPLEPNFIILDDCMGLLNHDIPVINNFWARFRHYNTTVILAVQYIAGQGSTNTAFREFITAAFIWQTNTKRALVNNYNTFGQRMVNQHQFNKTLDEVTSVKYRCLVYIPNPKDYPESEDGKEAKMYSHWLADPPPSFKLSFERKKKNTKSGRNMSIMPSSMGLGGMEEDAEKPVPGQLHTFQSDQDLLRYALQFR